jgi:hypothetical protein
MGPSRRPPLRWLLIAAAVLVLVVLVLMPRWAHSHAAEPGHLPWSSASGRLS